MQPERLRTPIRWRSKSTAELDFSLTHTFGGHTPCVEVRCGERLFIVDAGTGLTALGTELGDRLARKRPVAIGHGP